MGYWAIGLMGCGALIMPAAVHAQAARSTLQGVYTEAQASKGQEKFAFTCEGCHTASTHTGTAFTNTWAEKPLAELFIYISQMMPKDNPGTLKPEETAQLVAYLLKLNEMPPGDQELPADTAQLKSITFVVREAVKAAKPAKR